MEMTPILSYRLSQIAAQTRLWPSSKSSLWVHLLVAVCIHASLNTRTAHSQKTTATTVAATVYPPSRTREEKAAQESHGEFRREGEGGQKQQHLHGDRNRQVLQGFARSNTDEGPQGGIGKQACENEVQEQDSEEKSARANNSNSKRPFFSSQTNAFFFFSEQRCNCATLCFVALL